MEIHEEQSSPVLDFIYVPFSAACAHFIVERANASIGSIHFFRSGSSSGKTSRISSEARMTVFTALTRRTCSAILSKFCAPSMSFLSKASIAGIIVCSKVALSGSTTSNPYMHQKKVPQNETEPVTWIKYITCLYLVTDNDKRIFLLSKNLLQSNNLGSLHGILLKSLRTGKGKHGEDIHFCETK